MRIEPAPLVLRGEDRRQRFEEKRREGERRRQPQSQERQRARHPRQPWLAPAFGAQLLGQRLAPSIPAQASIERAYAQPEARTPLRPRLAKTA